MCACAVVGGGHTQQHRLWVEADAAVRMVNFCCYMLKYGEALIFEAENEY
jgi:hypothetical protein